jgi:hypothetical protein
MDSHDMRWPCCMESVYGPRDLCLALYNLDVDVVLEIIQNGVRAFDEFHAPTKEKP